MSVNVNLKTVVKHLVNGSIDKYLCRVCLLSLDDLAEHVFTKICKEDQDYCIADVLQDVCQIKVDEREKFKVCSKCFVEASIAYKFFTQSKRSTEIIEGYINQLNTSLKLGDFFEVKENNYMYLKLNDVIPENNSFDYDLKGLEKNRTLFVADKKIKLDKEEKLLKIKEEPKSNSILKKRPYILHEKNIKHRRRRYPMEYMKCSRCPVQYRFITKLKAHMKSDHNVDLYFCKLCKTMCESKESYNEHLETHLDSYVCQKCNVVFRKSSTLESHMTKHEQREELIREHGTFICEKCGAVMEDEESLKNHYDSKHNTKFTCYYCGRMYKGELSFDLHIKKHEFYIKKNSQKDEKPTITTEAQKTTKSIRHKCVTCNRTFVDSRALLWHRRLHDNERPYVCNVCDRAFVSANRRNQHTLCAHSEPTRRCPLCPALFHLRSMVNSHIKKVHLNTHRRRNRAAKYQDVSWRTEIVPIEELSVAVQNELVELKTVLN